MFDRWECRAESERSRAESPPCAGAFEARARAGLDAFGEEPFVAWRYRMPSVRALAMQVDPNRLVVLVNVANLSLDVRFYRNQIRRHRSRRGFESSAEQRLAWRLMLGMFLDRLRAAKRRQQACLRRLRQAIAGAGFAIDA